MSDVKSVVRPKPPHSSDISIPPDALPPIDDYYRWSFEQAAHIRAGRFDSIDRMNVADEIEDVGKREFRSLTSNLEITLAHLLKWHFQPDRRSPSWQDSIEEHRERVRLDIRESPSMAAKQDLAIENAYRLARYRAAKETKRSLQFFPESCPYSWSQIMDVPYEFDRS